MKTEIKYIELKSGYHHNGPAWISEVAFSKSGKTVYFNNRAFQSIGNNRLRGNFYDIESLEEYWISGVKKDKRDRHTSGSGIIRIDKKILKEYLGIVDQTKLEKSKYDIVEVQNTAPVERIKKFLNEKLTDEKYQVQLNRYLCK